MKSIRRGSYCLYEGKEFELVIEPESCKIVFRGTKNDFIEKHNFSKYATNIYVLSLDCTNIASAYYVETFCIYNDLKFSVDKILDKGKYRILPSEETQLKLKDSSRHGYDPVYEVSEEEIQKIWEERKPVKGFEFNAEPVFILNI
jgi:hypothetical protein